MKPHSTTILLSAIALALSGCASNGGAPQAKAAAPGVQTEEMGAVSPQKTAAAKVSVSRLTATVKSLDMDTRMVTLAGPEGDEIVFQADEQVRNLGQVRVGDKVTVEYYEGLVADLRTGAAAQREAEAEMITIVERAALGERPAGAVGKAVKATVVIQFVDRFRKVVQFTGPLGKTHIVKVTKPEFQAMLKNLKAGDQVDLVFFEALAIAVTPAEN